jgi:hypothetical protein
LDRDATTGALWQRRRRVFIVPLLLTVGAVVGGLLGVTAITQLLIALPPADTREESGPGGERITVTTDDSGAAPVGTFLGMLLGITCAGVAVFRRWRRPR